MFSMNVPLLLVDKWSLLTFGENVNRADNKCKLFLNVNCFIFETCAGSSQMSFMVFFGHVVGQHGCSLTHSISVMQCSQLLVYSEVFWVFIFQLKTQNSDF